MAVKYTISMAMTRPTGWLAYVRMVQWLERRFLNWKIEGSIPELWPLIDSHVDLLWVQGPQV